MTTVVTVNNMVELSLRDAKATLSAVIDGAVQGEPTIITRHGRKAAVVLSYEDWRRLSDVTRFGRLLMACPIEPADLEARDERLLRDTDF